MDSTVLLQTGVPILIFLTIWYVLGNYVFKPFLANLEEREERTAGDERRAVETRQKTLQVQAQLDEQLTLIRLEGIRVRDDYVAGAKAEAGKITEQAFQRSLKEIESARVQIEAMRSRVRGELQSEAQVLSGAILDKLLRTSGDRVVH